MSESSYTTPAENVPTLPRNFLAVDQRSLTHSAAKVRGRADLVSGQIELHNNFWAVSGVGLALSTEQGQQERDVLRGTLIAYKLLLDSTLDFGNKTATASEAVLSMATTPSVSANQQAFLNVRQELLAKRARVLNELPDDAYFSLLGDILDISGLTVTSFDKAVGNLSGAGVESQQTNLNDARYGAAILVLSIAAQNPVAEATGYTSGDGPSRGLV